LLRSMTPLVSVVTTLYWHLLLSKHGHHAG